MYIVEIRENGVWEFYSQAFDLDTAKGDELMAEEEGYPVRIREEEAE